MKTVNSSKINLDQQFRRHIDTSWPELNNCSILVAVSGGLDSIVLLDLFLLLAKSRSFRLTAGHINHHLRPGADSDMEFVRGNCQQKKIQLLTAVLDPELKQAGSSTEAWAREGRYQALAEMAESEDINFIATAHHLNDQAETVLMHIADGCGFEGLKGIRRRRGNLIRPLLPFSRAQLLDYAIQNKLSWVEDDTNQDITLTRNFIRHCVLKDWSDQNIKLLGSIRYLSERAYDYHESQKYIIERLYPELVIEDKEGGFKLNGEKLADLPRQLRLAIINRICSGEGQTWRRHNWESLERFLKNPGTGRFMELPGGWVILSNRSEWLIKRSTSAELVAQVVVPESTTDCGPYRLTWRKVKSLNRFTDNAWSEYIDTGFLQGKTLVLRAWQPGDRFHPLGMKGSKKVSDFLIDEQMDRFRKQEQLVLAAGDEVFWVCGIRISEKIKVTESSVALAELSIERDVDKYDKN